MLYPHKLKEKEYICLLMIQTKKDGKEIKFQRFVKNFEQYEEIIKKYKHNYNIYNCISIVKEDRNGNIGRTKVNIRQRRVLFIDFDKKDYPHLKDAHDFTNLIKEKFPELFLHAYYDSGNGIHYYVIIPQTCDIDGITNLNKDISALVGADVNACKTTQVARVPCSYNFKKLNENGAYPLVKEIDHYMNNPHTVKNFHPCNIEYIRRRIANIKKLEKDTFEEKPLEVWNYGENGYDFPIYQSLCTEKILREGAVEHQRNIWLGRIISMLLSQGYTESKIRVMCLDWNAKCRPPKNIKVISNEISKYLEMKDIYNFHGCWENISDSRVKEIVCQQCDKFHCMQAIYRRNIVIEKDIGVKMSQGLLAKSKLQNNSKNEMNGFEYLILAVLYKNNKPYSKKKFTVKDLKNKMQYKKSGKWQLCIDVQTFNKTLNNLVKHNCIEIIMPGQCKKKKPVFDDMCIKMRRRLKEFDDKYIEFYYSTARAFICKQITATEFKVFLCIVNNAKNGRSCTIENLNETLRIGEPHVMRAIKSLELAQCIEIIQDKSSKGNWYNIYSQKNTDKWNDLTINEVNNNIDINVDVPNNSNEVDLVNGGKDNNDDGNRMVMRLLA